MVTMVLLNDAFTWAIALPTFLRILAFFFGSAAWVVGLSAAAGVGPAVGVVVDMVASSRHFLRIFLLATVFRGPLRERALLRVRWPRTGRGRGRATAAR